MAQPDGETTWHLVCAADEISIDDGRRFELNGDVYAIWHTPSGFHGTQGLCTHEQANLADGFISGEYVACPKHNSRFHIPTGKATRVPARVDLKTFPVKEEGGKLFLGLQG